MDSSDRYLITGFLGLSQTGIYSASINGIGELHDNFFHFPISFVIFPIVTRLWEKGDISGVKRYLEYSTKIFLFLGIPGSAGVYVLSKPLLVILTTSAFSVGGGILGSGCIKHNFLGNLSDKFVYHLFNRKSEIYANYCGFKCFNKYFDKYCSDSKNWYYWCSNIHPSILCIISFIDLIWAKSSINLI